MSCETSQYGIILVTAGSENEADAIASELVKSKLAACVTVFPVRSIYTWQGEVNRDREVQILIKTNLDRFPEIAAKIRELHSYELPEIIALPIVAGLQPYLDWIGEQTG